MKYTSEILLLCLCQDTHKIFEEVNGKNSVNDLKSIIRKELFSFFCSYYKLNVSNGVSQTKNWFDLKEVVITKNERKKWKKLSEKKINQMTKNEYQMTEQ